MYFLLEKVKFQCHVSFREGMSLVKILRLTHSLHRAQVFFTFVGSFAGIIISGWVKSGSSPTIIYHLDEGNRKKIRETAHWDQTSSMFKLQLKNSRSYAAPKYTATFVEQKKTPMPFYFKHDSMETDMFFFPNTRLGSNTTGA